MPRNLKISQEEAKHLTIAKVKGTVCQFDFVELKVQDRRSFQVSRHFVPFQRLEPESGIERIDKDSWNLKPETRNLAQPNLNQGLKGFIRILGT